MKNPDKSKNANRWPGRRFIGIPTSRDAVRMLVLGQSALPISLVRHWLAVQDTENNRIGDHPNGLLTVCSAHLKQTRIAWEQPVAG